MSTDLKVVSAPKTRKPRKPYNPNELTAEQAKVVARFPESQRVEMTKVLIAGNVAGHEVRQLARTTFRAAKNGKGNLVIYGLGNRFPLGIRPDSLKILLEHADELKKLI